MRDSRRRERPLGTEGFLYFAFDSLDRKRLATLMYYSGDDPTSERPAMLMLHRCVALMKEDERFGLFPKYSRPTTD